LISGDAIIEYQAKARHRHSRGGGKVGGRSRATLPLGRSHYPHWAGGILTARGAALSTADAKSGVAIPSRPSVRSGARTGLTALRETYPKLKLAPGLVLCPVERPQRLNETDYALSWGRR